MFVRSPNDVFGAYYFRFVFRHVHIQRQTFSGRRHMSGWDESVPSGRRVSTSPDQQLQHLHCRVAAIDIFAMIDMTQYIYILCDSIVLKPPQSQL